MYAQKSYTGRANCVMEKHFLGFLAVETLQGARRRCSPRVFPARGAPCPHKRAFISINFYYFSKKNQFSVKQNAKFNPYICEPSFEGSQKTMNKAGKMNEKERRADNAKKAKETADRLFPGEKWNQKPEYGERIYVSDRRKTGSKTNFKVELHDAQILRDIGSAVYLPPEDKKSPGKKFDAIVDGKEMEFKNMSGKADDTLIDHFYQSRKQAPNVFINLEESPLSRERILRVLYGARNSPKYDNYNKFPEGGILIIKIKGYKELQYLDINKMKK